jgi:membrane-associated protein
MLEQLLELKHYIDPQFILNAAGPWVLPILCLIVFAETGLMAGFFLPGDSLLFITGLFVATGYVPVSLPVLLLMLTIAAILGDQTGYLIGRSLGKALFTREESFFFKPEYVRRTKAFYDKYGGSAIILGRFVPIVRTFVPTVAGVAGLEYRKFIGYNVLGGILWINSMTLLGYLPAIILGKEKAELYIKPYVHYIALVIILLSVLPILFAYLRSRTKQKAD